MSIIKELEGLKRTVSPASKINELREYNKGVNDAIEIVTKHTAPQPNLEEVEKLVVFVGEHNDTIYHAHALRTRIGYTLDANGKPVAIQKGGEE